MHRLEIRRTAGDLAGMPAGTGEQHRQLQPDAARVEPPLLRAEQLLQLGQPPLLLWFGDLAGDGRGWRARPRRVFEAERLREADLAHQGESRSEISLRLP